MSPPSYYLVNRTRKEFCYFENEESIIKILRDAFLEYDTWRYNDDVIIESEDAGYTFLVEHLTTGLGYVDLDDQY